MWKCDAVTKPIVALFCLLVMGCTAVIFADEQSQYTDYIVSLETLEQKEFTAILLAAIDHYLEKFPEANNLDKIHMKKATIFLDQKEEIEAFFTHMEIIYMYPQSEVATVARDRMKTLIAKDGKFKSLRGKADSIVNPVTAGGNAEESYYKFIQDMVALQFDRIYTKTVAACDIFLSRHPNSIKAHEVLYWKAQILERDERYHDALAAYLKLTHIFNQSLYVTACKLKMAELFNAELKMHQKAILMLEEFLLEYPSDPQAPQAQFQMAQIIEKRKKQYLEAINVYNAVATKYPKSVEAVPALFESARLYEDRFKEYDQAIRIYSEVVRDFPDDIKSPYALTESARIYEKRLKDPLNAAQVYYRVYEIYPESSIAAESLYKSAELMEKRVKDLEKARNYYQTVVDKYGADDLAGKAAKRIEKIDKEISKGQAQPETEG